MKLLRTSFITLNPKKERQTATRVPCRFSFPLKEEGDFIENFTTPLFMRFKRIKIDFLSFIFEALLYFFRITAASDTGGGAGGLAESCRALLTARCADEVT